MSVFQGGKFYCTLFDNILFDLFFFIFFPKLRHFLLVIRGGFIGGFYVNVPDDCCLESTKKNGNSELCCIQFIP